MNLVRSPVFNRLAYVAAWPMVHRFFAGLQLRHALTKTAWLNSMGFGAIIDYIGEDISDKTEIIKTGVAYQHLIDGVHGQKLLADVSMKPSQYGIHEPRTVWRHGVWQKDFPEISQVLERAHLSGVRPWLDAELLKSRRDTWLLAKEVHRHNDFVGVALQAYGTGEFDSIEFFDNVLPHYVEYLPKGKILGLRLCKGAYTSSEQSILRDSNEIRERFSALCERALELTAWSQKRGKGILYPEFATQDLWAIDELKRETRRRNIHPSWFRFAMLLGRQRNSASHLVAEGFTLFVYVPVGIIWIPYFGRRIKEKPEYALAPFSLEGKYHRCESWPESCRARSILSRFR